MTHSRKLLITGFRSCKAHAREGRDRKCLRFSLAVGGLIILLAWSGCMKPQPAEPVVQRPNIAPSEVSDMVPPLALDPAAVKPMYTEMVAVDLASVVKVARAGNAEIRKARQMVEVSRGEYERTVGAAFPVIVPLGLFEHVRGTVRATPGNLTGVGFSTFQPSIAVQWVVNPGRVIHDILAAKKRVSATEDQERAVILETLRRAVVQYYDLVLAQARVSAASQGVKEAEELLRINQLRFKTGTGVLADKLRAEARVAERRQDLVTGLNAFYESSVALSLTLHLESAVTLVPKIEDLPPIHLVRNDLSIDESLGIALAFRPDLKGVRKLVEVAVAETDAGWWASFGPQLQVSYQYGGIMGHAKNVIDSEGVPGNLIVNPTSANGSFSANPLASGLIKEGILRGSRSAGGRKNQSFGLKDQQRIGAGVGWRLSLAAFGELKKAKAWQAHAIIEAEAHMDRVAADVVSATQASKANHELIGLAHQQVLAAEEALRLTEANLRVGTVTTLDVLQAQDAATQARLRYARAVVRYDQSQVNLLAALGLLDVESLGLSSNEDDQQG